MSGTADAGGLQLSLLHGFGTPKLPRGVPGAAANDPIAQVILDSPLPHLDRLFDYFVPADLDAAAQPGVRVKVRFAGREHTGYVAHRCADSSTSATLHPLGAVVSGQPVLTPEILSLARAVAARSAGMVSDVLRLALPPRAARVDQEFGPDTAADGGSAAPGAGTVPQAPGPGSGSFPRYENGAAFLLHLAAGESPRAVLTSVGGYGPRAWPEELADAVAAAVSSGRGAVVVVPDQRDLARVEAALVARLGSDSVARLTGEDGPTPRYRNFLRLLHGQARVAVGTRSAAYAPVRDLGLICLWDDGDDLHLEQRAPYHHVRDVVLLRAEQENAAVLLASVARSTEAHRLVDAGWARSIHPGRPEVRRSTPRVQHATDAFQVERDPLAAQARIPHAAWKAAQDGLKRGPVLLQVARTGFSPATACEQCRNPARCSACTGPLAQQSRFGPLSCRWCGRPDSSWRCPHCGSGQIRATVSGATRTAEELGRAFPGVAVVSSAGEHIVDTVPDAPAVVVATPGAEPLAANGYAAVILLDGTALLSRESLRAGEDALRKWFTAAVLARPADQGGLVVATGDDDATIGHLVRWDPRGAASRELALRQELGLPPSVRYAALTGSRESLAAFLEGIDVQLFVRRVGPVPVPPAAGRPVETDSGPAATGGHRLLVFFTYRNAAAAVAQLRARRMELSARRTSEPVHIRCDAVDIL
ncbi:primosomal protein N' [Arthrobacter sp. Br18]|uniref:primosomal protein N' n=1 Tax=Arthrobacter sp. Br18 TaxID=1312954 RepID=UPI00047EF8DC|nr:primosomal protein N' [Arthrobacter sp. Br18]